MEAMKMPRREKEKLRQRQEMLAAALGLFSEKGYHNVSMHEIAGKAEFAIGTLYKFFKNKEELYKTLVLELSDKFHDALTEAVQDTDDEIERLRNYVRAKGRLFRANVPMIRLYFSENRGSNFSVAAGLVPEIRDRYDQFPRMALRRPDSENATALALMPNCSGRVSTPRWLLGMSYLSRMMEMSLAILP